MKKGSPWGRPASGPPDLEVRGGDPELATWVSGAPGALVRYHPDAASDLGRAVGLADRPGAGDTEVPFDAVRLPDGTVAVNMVVVGTPPDRLTRFSRRRLLTVLVDGEQAFEGRATTVVVASGQFLRGADVVPGGHPGDGRLEVQVYRLRPEERRAMRSRLEYGEHLPHPRILQRAGREVEVRVSGGDLALEVDGAARLPVSSLSTRVVPEAFRLLV